MNITEGTTLITGAEGFIGSHLTEALLRRGAPVRAMVLYNSFNAWGWLDHLDPSTPTDNLEVILADVRDAQAVDNAVAGCDTVLHLAALIAIPYSYNAPQSYIDTNITGTHNIVAAARKHAVAKVVHTSTSEVYGSARYTPIDEAHPFQPQSPYSASKIAADHIALSYFHAFETPVAVVRPFNTFGPRQSNRAVIPTVITQIAAGATEIKLGALEPRRDFTYAEDTAAGIIAVAESDRTVGEYINLGTGYDISIAQTVDLIKDIMGSSATVTCDEQRLRPEGSEVDRLLACNKKARELTGWTPELAGPEGLREAMTRTIDWFTDPANLARYKADQYAT